MKLTDLNVIRELLGEEGTSFKKKYGQNFLTNESVVQRIADSCRCESLGVLEIGPGIGVLTQKLCEVADKVVCVEIDSTLLPILDKTLADYDNVTVVCQDILKVNLEELVNEYFTGCENLAVCANLPYYITTPIIMALLESGIAFRSITVMVQKEVAERLCAPPNHEAYGSISAAIAYYGTAKRLFNVSAGNFVPAPKVDSAVVKIDLYEDRPVKPADEAVFFKVVSSAFGQRRKTLINALCTGFGDLTKEEITQIVTSCGFSPNVRGETLGTAQFAMIADAITSRRNKSDGC